MLNEYSNILTKAKVYKKVDTVMRIVSIENIVMVNKTIKANKAVGVDSVTKYDWNEHVIENGKDFEVGSQNISGILSLKAAIEYIESIELKNIQDYILF